MTITLNHTIVWCRDRERSAGFFVELFGRPEPVLSEPFLVVELDNGVSLDYHAIEGEVALAHYAFLVSEPEFDEIYGRIVAAGLAHWANPSKSEPGINRHDGGRGTYFDDPDGHLLEIITRPYGSGG